MENVRQSNEFIYAKTSVVVSTHIYTYVLSDFFTPHQFASSWHCQDRRNNIHPHLRTYLPEYRAYYHGETKPYPNTLFNIRPVRIHILRLVQTEQKLCFCKPTSVTSIHSLPHKAVCHSTQHTSNTDPEQCVPNCNFTSQCTSSLSL